MKRILMFGLFLAFMVTALCVPACADVIWVPDNNFHRAHQDECSYHDRIYLANGSEGYVTVRSAPDSVVEVLNISNGTRFCVEYIWTDEDGTQWGIGRQAGTFNAEEGWVPLAEMARIYDYQDFAEDHGSEFEEYTDSGDLLETAYTYSYPGGVFSGVVDDNGSLSFEDSFTHLYTDGNGLRWAFLRYHMGSIDVWVCIDDPMNSELGTEKWLTVDQVRGGSDTSDGNEMIPPAAEIPPAKKWDLWLIPAALIMVVVAVTAFIVRKNRKKKT